MSFILTFSLWRYLLSKVIVNGSISAVKFFSYSTRTLIMPIREGNKWLCYLHFSIRRLMGTCHLFSAIMWFWTICPNWSASFSKGSSITMIRSTSNLSQWSRNLKNTLALLWMSWLFLLVEFLMKFTKFWTRFSVKIYSPISSLLATFSIVLKNFSSSIRFTLYLNSKMSLKLFKKFILWFCMCSSRSWILSYLKIVTQRFSRSMLC